MVTFAALVAMQRGHYDERGDEIWQYGSDEEKMKNNGTPWLLDGVAPQCPIHGISTNRAFIPDDMPQGFVESHTIKNYEWIFTQETIIKIQKPKILNLK